MLPFDASAATQSDLSQANVAIENAYTALYNAQIKDHANVSALTAQLNNATQHVNAAIAENSTNPTMTNSDLASAVSIARQVSSETGAASDSGLREHLIQTYVSILETIVILVDAILIFVVSSLIHRWWWMDAHRNYKVKLKRGLNVKNIGIQQRQSARMGLSLSRGARKKLYVSVLVLVTIILILAALQPIFSPFSSVQRNSQLGLLGPNETASNYPTNVTVNHPFAIYGYLANEEGTSQYYNVMVKLGNQTTLINSSAPANAPIVTEYFHVLNNNQTYIFPMNLSISQAGTGKHLIFELWSYQLTSSGWKFVYTGIFDQLTLNVAAPQQ